MKITKRYKEVWQGCEVRADREYVYLRTTSYRGGCLEQGGYIDRVHRVARDIEPVRRALSIGGSSATINLVEVVKQHGSIIRKGNIIQ